MTDGGLGERRGVGPNAVRIWEVEDLAGKGPAEDQSDGGGEATVAGEERVDVTDRPAAGGERGFVEQDDVIRAAVIGEEVWGGSSAGGACWDEGTTAHLQ